MFNDSTSKLDDLLTNYKLSGSLGLSGYKNNNDYMNNESKIKSDMNSSNYN